MNEEADVAAAIRAMIDAVNRGDMAQAVAAFAHDAVIVEDLPPYRWTGATAPSEWIAAMAANASKSGITSVVMEAGEPIQVDVDGSRAYAVFPGLLRLGTAGAGLTAEGLITFTAVREANRWLIETLVWSGSRPQ